MLYLALRALWSKRSRYILVLIEMTIGFLSLALALGIWSNARAVTRVANSAGPQEMRIFDVQGCPLNQIKAGTETIRKDPAVANVSLMYYGGGLPGDDFAQTVEWDSETAQSQPQPLRVSAGRWFTAGDFTSVGSTVPAIVGYKVLPNVPVGGTIPRVGAPSLVVIGRLQPGQTSWLVHLDPLRSIVTTDSLVITPPALVEAMTAKGSVYRISARLLIVPHPGQSEGVATAVRRSSLAACANGNDTLKAVIQQYNDARRGVLLLTAVLAAVVLIVGTLGFTGVCMATTQQRAREFGVRLALGASKMAVASQVIWETAVLSIIAAAASIPLATWFGAGLAVTVPVLDLTLVCICGGLIGIMSCLAPLVWILRAAPVRLLHNGR